MMSHPKPYRAPLILVVEDEPLVADVVEEVLVEWGFRVLRAANAADAISILTDDRNIALVFSDVVMPGDIDGFGLAGWIDVNYPNGKILLTSGYFPGDYVERNLGHASLLAKPYSWSELRDRIVGLIGELPTRPLAAVSCAGIPAEGHEPGAP
jgi:CheY-like chemotaxis protein